MCEFCSVDGERCAVCGYDCVSAGSLAGRLASVNQQIEITRAALASLERERASLRDQLGLRPADGSDQPSLFLADEQPELFGAAVAFDV